MSKLKRLFKYLLENWGERVFYMLWIPGVIFTFVMLCFVFLDVLPKILLP